LKPIFDEEFPKIDWDPFCFLIRKDPKLGQVPTLEGWDRNSACPSGTGLVQANGTGTLLVPNLSHCDRERSKETCHLSQGQVIYPRWRPVPVPGTGSVPTLEACPCPGTGPIPTMEPVSVHW